MKAWRKPGGIFAPHYRQVGFLHCVSEGAPEKAFNTLQSFWASAKRHPEVSKCLASINSREDILREVWQYENGSLPGWKGYFNRYDGYAHSGNALKAVYEACAALGVRFLLGEAGRVSELVYQNNKATGVRTADGTTYGAKLVIVAAGAAAGNLVPDLGTQVVAKSWSVAHVKLTDKEAAVLRGIPVTYSRSAGFMFEPEVGTNLLKLCPMGGGFINTHSDGVSRPPQTLEESEFMPAEDEARCRTLLAQTLPWLANRPFINKTLCWFADTADSDFIIDYVPDTANSVVLLSGDSGHGFKMFPIIGKWVKELLAAQDCKQSVARWRWKGRTEGGNWGDKVSWRLGASEEFRDINPTPAKAKL